MNLIKSHVIILKKLSLNMLIYTKWKMDNNTCLFCLKIQFMNNMVKDRQFLIQCQRISQLCLCIHLLQFLKHFQDGSYLLKKRAMIMQIQRLIYIFLRLINRICRQPIYEIFQMLILLTYSCSFSSFISLLIGVQYQMKLYGQDRLSEFVLQC